MKAKTKKNVGLVTAAIVIIFGMGLPPFSSINILGLLAWVVVPAIYIYALRKRKLKLARTAFYIYFSQAMLAMIIILIRALADLPAVDGFLLAVGFLLGLTAFLLYVGWRGLESMLNTEIQPTKEVLQNPEKD